MSTTNTDSDSNSAESSSGGQPIPGANTSAMEPSSSNGGTATEESNSPNKPESASGSLTNVPTKNATNSSRSSRYLHQCFLSSGKSDRMELDRDALEEGARSTGTYAGALIMTAAVVPVVAALISAVAFIVQRPRGPDWLTLPGMPLLLGTVPTLIVWLLLAFLVRRLTAVDRMDMASYDLLLNRLSDLITKLSTLSPEPGETPAGVTKPDANARSAPPPSAVAFTMASKEVKDCCTSICEKLRKKKNLAWVTASGYINLWKEMHHAEEALIDMLPRNTVVSEALDDEMRIQGSKIETSNELLDKLRGAVAVLNSSMEANHKSVPSKLQEGLNGPSAAPASTGDAPVTTEEKVADEEIQARSDLREVRHVLNEFRDNRWEAIVRVRNQFVCTMILTGLTMYVLLQFAILAGAPQATMISATAFFLVGALVGLFYRLYNESQTSKSIDDYRLALARLVAIPTFSGLAAVGGVLLTQKFTSLVNVFDPKNILAELIVAAAFGLTPSLLFGVLQKQTEQYKTDLKSTESTRR